MTPMRFDEIRDRLHQLRAIPLESVLAAIGGKRDPHDKAKWRTAKGAISITGIKFMNWNQLRRQPAVGLRIPLMIT
jgi:hypothetical protein